MDVRKSYLKYCCKVRKGIPALWLFVLACTGVFATPSLPPLRNRAMVDSSLVFRFRPLYPFSGSGAEAPGPEFAIRNQIERFALRYLGRPYRSSGKKPSTGFDCSGFTGFVFRHVGIPIKASSTAQATEGRRVELSEARTGDLAFFGRKGKRGKRWVNHAAIVISKPGQPLSIIHAASGKGIVITRVMESRYWRNALLFVRRVV